MKKLTLLLLFLTAVACSDSKGTAALLNGYWEIKTVKMPDGKAKDFPPSPTVDYFELKDNKGFRKKVMPQVDGTYRASDSSEEVAVAEKDGKTWLNYTALNSKYQEELVSISDDELVTKNTFGMEFHYIRPENFTVK